MASPRGSCGKAGAFRVERTAGGRAGRSGLLAACHPGERARGRPCPASNCRSAWSCWTALDVGRADRSASNCVLDGGPRGRGVCRSRSLDRRLPRNGLRGPSARRGSCRAAALRSLSCRPAADARRWAAPHAAQPAAQGTHTGPLPMVECAARGPHASTADPARVPSADGVCRAWRGLSLCAGIPHGGRAHGSRAPDGSSQMACASVREFT